MIIIFVSLLQFSSILLLCSSQEYTIPEKYFINCGSDAIVSFPAGRKFTGDLKSDSSLLIDTGESDVIKNDTVSNSIPEIYHTARVYKKPTWYVFYNIDQNGTYVIRLHFFPISSKKFPNLPKSKFDVFSSSKYPLLTNFSLDESKPTETVHEFLLDLEKGDFGLLFSPSSLQIQPLAFVNAIELFLAPSNLKPKSENAYPVSPEVRDSDNDSSYNLTSIALKITHRVNMGGGLVTPDKDSFLWRTWLPDDGFLVNPTSAKNITYQGRKPIKYTLLNLYIAPSIVYNTAKELDFDSGFSTLIWVFKVKKKTKYFLNYIWCDFTKEWRDGYLFDFIVGLNRTSIDSSNMGVTEFAQPTKFQMVIFTDNSGFFNVGIGSNVNSKIPRAFLNGFEMMELIEKSNISLIPPIQPMQKSKKKSFILIGGLVGGVVSISLVIGLILAYFRVRKSQKSYRLYREFLSRDKQGENSITDIAPNLKLELKIPFREIKAATDGFSDEKLIGVGGFGNVYKGILHEKEVAVKRSRPGFGQGLNEFRTEIIILSQIRHRRLVSLYGYCHENEEMILVYEYMEKGTLRDYLYGKVKDSRIGLSWKQRVEICIDSAKGLDYLHTSTAKGVIIHRDVKTTNILLDDKFEAKVADFGISKSGIPKPDEFETTIRGTYGYLDPSYFNNGQLTEKSDVYSFGVVLLEVLSARSPIDKSLPHEQINLADWAILCIQRGETERLIDPALHRTIEQNSLRKFIEIAASCLRESPAERPSMHEVVYDLELALQFHLTPMGIDDGSTIVVDGDSQWELPSQILERIPSMENLDDNDSSVIMNADSSTVIHAKEMASQFKIDCGR